MISMFSSLTYLDTAPVTEADRRMAKAFMEGGKEKEREEMLKIQQEKQHERTRIIQSRNTKRKQLRCFNSPLSLSRVSLFFLSLSRLRAVFGREGFPWRLSLFGSLVKSNGFIRRCLLRFYPSLFPS